VKKTLVLFLAFAIATVADAAATDTNQPFVGVYQNKESEFEAGGIALNNDGKGALISIALGPIFWKSGPEKNQLTLIGSFGGDPRKSNSIVVFFDPDKKAILMHGTNSAAGDRYYLTTNQVPVGLHNLLLHFDGTEQSMSHPTDTVFAMSVTNHVEDLQKLHEFLGRNGFLCDVHAPQLPEPSLEIDVRDLALAKSYATNAIVRLSLTVKIRMSITTNIFEVWKDGKKSAKEHYKYNNGYVPEWPRP